MYGPDRRRIGKLGPIDEELDRWFGLRRLRREREEELQRLEQLVADFTQACAQPSPSPRTPRYMAPEHHRPPRHEARQRTRRPHARGWGTR